MAPPGSGIAGRQVGSCVYQVQKCANVLVTRTRAAKRRSWNGGGEMHPLVSTSADFEPAWPTLALRH